MSRDRGDRQAGDAVLGHDVEGLAEGDVRGDGDGVDDHAGFGALDAVDLLELAVDGEIAVNDADAALACDGDGEARFGDGVHGGGGERDVELELAGELRGGVDFGGQDGGFAREEEDVVEGESFVDGTVDHGSLENWDLMMGLDRRAQTEVCATGGRSEVRPVHWELLMS